MAIQAAILPEPIWYFVDDSGKPLSGGFLYIRQGANPDLNALVYQDTGGVLAYPTTTGPRGVAIPIALNGTLPAGPIYWDITQDYYIFWTTFDDLDVDAVNHFGAAVTGGGGGGGPITNVFNLQNLIPNNTFYRHVGTDNAMPNTPTTLATAQLLTLAPGAHAGLSAFAASVNANGPAAPDITFIKNNLAATDTIGFGSFPLGDTSFATFNDSTPLYYLNYSCTGAAAENYKYVQFPITGGATNLDGQIVTGKIYIRWNSGNANIKLYLRQFYGDGPSASADQIFPVMPVNTPLNTDTNWHSYPLVFTVPSGSGKTYGECGNDGLFLIVEYPLDVACNIDITKPTLFVGGNVSPSNFNSNDVAEAICNEFRTGDVRTSLNSFSPMGWVPANDGTIGSLTSGATTRADRDTFPLYNLLWGNPYAPVTGGAGASAVADFAANKSIALTKTLGRLLASTGLPSSGTNVGTTWALGQTTGNEKHTISINEMAQHTHDAGAGGSYIASNTGGAFPLGAGPNSLTAELITGGISTYAGPTAINIQNPVTYLNVFFKL